MITRDEYRVYLNDYRNDYRREKTMTIKVSGKVGKRYNAEFRFDGNRFECHWTPHVPIDADVKKRRFYRDYSALRRRFYQQVADLIEGNGAVIDATGVEIFTPTVSGTRNIH